MSEITYTSAMNHELIQEDPNLQFWQFWTSGIDIASSHADAMVLNDTMDSLYDRDGNSYCT
jgi:uncharacterized membrane protein